MKVSLVKRFRGSLLGLALGDAMGAPLEFLPPGSFEPVNGLTSGGPGNVRTGEWTDDTSMALCLAESLIEKRGFDPIDQLKRYVRWRHAGHMSTRDYGFGIGNTVAAALDLFESTGRPLCGSTDPRSAGNGSLMRLAPVPLFFSDNPGLAIETSGISSMTTHSTGTCVDACRYFGGLILGAIQGISKEELLSDRFCPIPEYWTQRRLHPEIEVVASGSFKTLNPPEIIGSGYVVKSLEAALWAFHRSGSFEDGCALAVNLGDDADTTGAIYGQLAGAFYGEDIIPVGWRSQLIMRETIEAIADILFEMSGNTVPKWL
ncbi:MAG: ADP-ribosylglycohydrolase family protein [Pseudomonadota bacterium]